MIAKRPFYVIILAISICLLHALALAADDRELLLKLHEKVMRAHLQGNVDLLLEDETPDYVVAGRGEVSRPSLEERRARLGPYLASTTFETYVDMIPPVVRISGDGTLGWVVVQVEAKGEHKTTSGEKQPLEFVSAWIELYEKRDGRWYRTGNVSNFKS
jgi:hypothetical protein